LYVYLALCFAQDNPVASSLQYPPWRYFSSETPPVRAK